MHGRYSFTEDLSYSFSLSNWLYVNEPNKFNSLILLQELNYYNIIKFRSKLSISTTFSHEVGFQYLFDSLITKNADKNNLLHSFLIPLYKNISIQFSSSAETQLLPGFDIISNDTLAPQRIISSTFLTPLFCIFSLGFDYNNTNIGIFRFGISSAKLTYLHNPIIFKKSNQITFFGVPGGDNIRFEYGLSTNFVLDREIGKLIHWKCDIRAFKNFELPVDLNITNSISLKTSKYLKTSIRTKFLYNELISKTYRLENMITVGFYFDL